MEIETDRISIRELNEQDIPFLAEIARDIAVKDSTELLNKAQENSELCQFIQLYSPQLLKVPPQDSQIKDENLHCNFSMISPPFQDNAQKFFENAVNRKNESPRQSFWMAIKLKDSNAPIDGIIMMTTVTMGCSTPPVGVALYTCSSIMDCPVEETTKYSWPLFVAIFGTLLICIFLPDLILFLPNLVYGPSM